MRHRGSLPQLVACLLMVLTTVSARAQTGTFIDRLLPTDLRVISYNVLWDSIFPDKDAVKAAKFSRVINALNPDILNLQEIGDPFTPGWTPKNATDVRELLNDIAPLASGSWNVFKGSDSVIASKYPLTMTRATTNPAGDKSQAIAMVNLPDAQYATDFYVLNEHYKCCGTGSSSEDLQRRQQSDSIVNWLRDARTPGGNINIPAGTPFAIVGDLNTVTGSTIPLNTLITGNISDEATYGSDSPPDWDGTSLTDATPVHNGTGSTTYTWREDSGPFDPIRFDYIIYSDSALDIGRKFVLNTVSLTNAQRTATGLQQFDTAQGTSTTDFDHLPVVVDFRIFDFAEADFDYSRTVDATDLAAWQSNYGLPSGATRGQGDANGDGQINGRDFLIWQRQAVSGTPSLAAVPEPAAWTLLLIALAGFQLRRSTSRV